VFEANKAKKATESYAKPMDQWQSQRQGYKEMLQADLDTIEAARPAPPASPPTR
jgi:hypothetical protein